MFIVYDKHAYNLIWANPAPLEQIPDTEQDIYYQFNADQHAVICAETREAALNELLDIEAGKIPGPRLTIADLQASAAGEREKERQDDVAESAYIQAIRAQLSDKHREHLGRISGGRANPLPDLIQPRKTPENGLSEDFTGHLADIKDTREKARLAAVVKISEPKPEPAIIDIDETSGE